MDVYLPWISLPYLACSAKSFSLLRQGLNVTPPDALSYDMPLWHNALFKSSHFHTYSSPSLIKDGILTVGQLLEDDLYLHQIPPTWRSVYRETIGQLATQILQALSVLPYPRDREQRKPDEVWQSLIFCRLPRSHVDFIRNTL